MCSRLVQFHLYVKGGNQLEGGIPSEFGQIEQLQSINLGEISTQFLSTYFTTLCKSNMTKFF